MKNIKLKLLILASLIIGYFLFSSFDDPSEEIIGTWILEDDQNSKWVFTQNGTCYWYYNSVLEDSFSYSISQLPIQCGHQVKTGGEDDYYLKLVDQDNEEYCYEILGVSDTSLSLNFLGLADIKVFNKE